MTRTYVPDDGGPTLRPGSLGLDESSSSARVRAAGSSLPSISVVAVEFKSGHKKKLTDKDFQAAKPGFESGGKAFDQKEAWKIDPLTSVEKSHPVSHTAGQSVTLIVTVELRNHKDPLTGDLTGRVSLPGLAKPMKFVAKMITFEAGETSFEITSDKPLGKEVQNVLFSIGWTIKIPGMHVSPHVFRPNTIVTPYLHTSKNELLITLGEPLLKDEQEITYGRLAHAVEKAAATGTDNPHKLVEALVHGQSFDGSISTSDPWFLAKNPGTAADCITIARYIKALTQIIGMAGMVEAVIVYMRPKGKFSWKSHQPPDTKVFKGYPVPTAVTKIRLIETLGKVDFEAHEDPAPSSNSELSGMDNPLVVHRSEPWHLRLMDSLGGQNRFEACVKFTDAEKLTKWYAAGTKEPGFTKLDKIVPAVFKSLSWVSGKSAVIKEHIELY